MRKTMVFLACVVAFSYSYGVLSHAYRIFPMEQIGKIRSIIAPERGRPVSMTDVFSDVSGRWEVDCAKIARDAAVLLVVGQSNAANYGDARYRPSGPVYNYDWMNGRCYQAEDPLLGATGDGGTAWTRLGEILVERAIFPQVLIATVAAGGTSIHAWVGDKGPAARAVSAAHDLARMGLRVTHVLWQQGEADHEMPKETYIRLFTQMLKYLRDNGINAPIFVAKSTICNNRGSDRIRQAQGEIPLLLANAKVRAGPDTDTLDRIRDRAANLCHFSESGLAAGAQLWFEVLAQDHATAVTQSTPPTDRSPEIALPVLSSPQVDTAPYPAVKPD